MVTEAKINEIFSSIQGEGPVVGFKQLFIRFCGCNLNCNYCDTEYIKGKNFTPKKLYEKITKDYDLKTLHSISLTGGEPLLSWKFLKEFLPLVKKEVQIYLETNATLTNELNEIKDFIDIISADIKLPSCTNQKSILNLHEKFFKTCVGTYTFAKIVFDENITKEEIEFCTSIGQKYNIELILQPKMVEDKMSVSSEFCQKVLDKFTQIYPNTRLIPQVHKFLDVR